MIPWCMRAANSAGEAATGGIAPPRTQTLNWAELGRQKDLQHVKAGPAPSQDGLSCVMPRGKPFGLVTPRPHPLCGSVQIREARARSRCVVSGNNGIFFKAISKTSHTHTAPVRPIRCQKVFMYDLMLCKSVLLIPLMRSAVEIDPS